MKTVLASAGVDTEQFKAHSTRSVATSAAKFAGVLLRDITTKIAILERVSLGSCIQVSHRLIMILARPSIS